MTASAEVLERPALEAECRLLEQAILRERLAAAAELEPWRPGAERNPDPTILGVLRWFGRLQRIHARGEGRATNAARETADQALLAALEERPATVRLALPLLRVAALLSRSWWGRLLQRLRGGPVEPAVTHDLTIYPKGFAALVDLQLCDRRIAQLTAIAAVMREEDTPDARQTQRQAEEALAHYYGLLIWIVTHPGPGVPYAWDEANPIPPEWTRHLDPVDVLALVRAHLEVNVLRLTALTVLTHPDAADRQGPRPTWSMWFASLAEEAKTDAKRFTRDRSLEGLLAQHALAAEAQRQAMQAAKAAPET